MLYTFSQAHYSEIELQRYLTEITENDAVVLWQDGVLLAVKYGEMFTQCKGCLLYTSPSPRDTR